MKNTILKFGVYAVLFGSPFLAFAANNKTLLDIIKVVMGYLSVFMTLIIGLAVVTFVWNVYRYFFTDKDKKEAGMYVLYSVIGFFVILSLWGLVNILTNSLKLDNQKPAFPFSSGVGGTTQDPTVQNTIFGDPMNTDPTVQRTR